jgi:flagellar assembly protein FliH
MWCRLIKDEKASEARAIAWRQSDAPPGPADPSPTPRPLHVDAGSAQPEEHPAVAALRQAELNITAAYQRGVKEGEAAANQKLAAQTQTKIEQMGRAIEQLATHRLKIQREAEPELVRLAMAVARRILRRELSVDPESLLGLLKAGLEKIESADTHRVRVHPEHAAVLKRMLEGAARPIEVATDPGLPVGGLIFETSHGSVDVGMETQLKEIERGFTDLYPR